MEQSRGKTVSELELHEITQSLKEKVKRGDYTAADLDEYFNASRKLIGTKQDFDAGMDLIQARQDKLIAMMTRSVESISATNQQDLEASTPEG